jgi:putative membrane protein
MGFLATLLVGLLGAAFLLASTLEGVLETQPVIMSGVFLGLVLGAAVAARHQFEAPAGLGASGLVVVAAVVTATVLGVRPQVAAEPDPLLLGLTAAIAVCAMILPGISGSFLLLLLGTYEPIIAAVSDRELVTIGIVGLGAISGLLAFSTLLHWLLARAHDVLLALLMGLMIGSARVLWPWPAGAGVGDPALGAPQGQVVPTLLATVVALAAVVVLDRALRRGAAPAPGQPASGPSPRGSR